MPIKFRCMHCNQKLGIAQRKAGSQVQCPTCLQMVAVPHEDAELVEAVQPEPVAPALAGVQSPLFERSDFDEILKPPRPERVVTPRPAQAAVAPSPAAVWSAPLPSSYDVEPMATKGDSISGLAGPVGVLLTPGRATLLTVVVVLLLGLAFAAGLVVGRWVL